MIPAAQYCCAKSSYKGPEPAKTTCLGNKAAVFSKTCPAPEVITPGFCGLTGGQTLATHLRLVGYN